MTDTASTVPELVIERSFDAPRELVWRAFTERDALARWWGPHIFENTVISLDLRPGGMFHYGMRTMDGKQMYGRFIYGELAPPERMEYVSSFADERGHPVRAPWDDQWPLETASVITFEEQDGRTLLTLRAFPLNGNEVENEKFRGMFGSMQQGYGGTLDQLEKYLGETKNSF
jgi:uncharacterized protein YndB with AHSA1/START domain